VCSLRGGAHDATIPPGGGPARLRRRFGLLRPLWDGLRGHQLRAVPAIRRVRERLRLRDGSRGRRRRGRWGRLRGPFRSGLPSPLPQRRERVRPSSCPLRATPRRRCAWSRHPRPLRRRRAARPAAPRRGRTSRSTRSDRTLLLASGCRSVSHLDLAGVQVRRLVLTGGGVRVPEWAQALADCTGLPVDVAALPVGAALGSAFVARCVAGRETSMVTVAPT